MFWTAVTIYERDALGREILTDGFAEPEAPQGFIPLGAIAPAKKEEREEVGSFGD